MTSSVVLATAGYDHSIRFWEATSGICYRTLQYPDSQVSWLVTAKDRFSQTRCSPVGCAS